VTDSANLDLVRSIFAATERGDYSTTQWADPGVEYVLVDELQPFTAVGVAGLAEAMRTLFMDIADVHMEAEEYRELDHERVLVLTRFFGRGKRSGVPVSRRLGEVFEIHEGKVARVVVYIDRDRMYADLGPE
jgi:ketosteroid isomerase-like protein